MGRSRRATASQSICWELVQVSGVGDESQVTSACGSDVLFPYVPFEWSCWQMGVRILCAHLAWLNFHHSGLSVWTMREPFSWESALVAIASGQGWLCFVQALLGSGVADHPMFLLLAPKRSPVLHPAASAVHPPDAAVTFD